MPASWSVFKLDLMRHVARLANLDESAVVLLPEPVAAAYHYGASERLAPDSVVAVYDLGGGTFDATVVRRTDGGFTIAGQPEGIERLGGVDFDQAVFAHVARNLDGALDDLDPDDPASLAAVARIRRECVAAKEALSSDTEASVDVTLPGLHRRVRIVRAEFEAMIRPSLDQTLDALDRALQSADVTADELTSVLLVGGSSRIPLVGSLVTERLGRPVSVDASPKHAVALGAARASAPASAPRATVASPRVAQPPPAPTPARRPPPPPPVAQPFGPPPRWAPVPYGPAPRPTLSKADLLPKKTRTLRAAGFASIIVGGVLLFIAALAVSDVYDSDDPNPRLFEVSGTGIAYLIVVTTTLWTGAAPLALAAIARRRTPRFLVGVAELLIAALMTAFIVALVLHILDWVNTPNDPALRDDVLVSNIAAAVAVLAVVVASVVLVIKRRGRAAAGLAAGALLAAVGFHLVASPELPDLSGTATLMIPGGLLAAAGAAFGVFIPDPDDTPGP